MLLERTYDDDLARAGYFIGCRATGQALVVDARRDLDELPEDGLIVTSCRSGARNAVAASVLRRAGFDVAEPAGSYAGWSMWREGDRVQPAHRPAREPRRAGRR